MNSLHWSRWGVTIVGECVGSKDDPRCILGGEMA